MGLLNNWRGIRRIVQLVIIQLFCWLAWSVSFCLAQLDISEGVTGSVNFPSALAITCVGNLTVFVTTLIRGRLDLEIGARDALGILLGPKLTVIIDQNDEYALTTCGHFCNLASVVMLSNGRPNSSMREFMKSNDPIVYSVLIQFLPLRAAEHLGDPVRNVQRCPCDVSCNCIVFWTSELIRVMLDRRMPGTLKQLSPSLCLLPRLTCLRRRCHGCLLHTEEPHVVCQILENIGADSIASGDPICICIPLNDSSDEWSELLVRSFRSKDAEGRGVRIMASEVLEGYLAGGRGRKEGTVEYSIASFLVPRLTETLINIVLTVFLAVDGFSSSLVARRTVRDYIVDSKGNGIAANAFLTKAVVRCDAENTCQLLTFRGNLLNIRTIAITVGCVNVVCSIVWAVLIAFDSGADSSPPLSMPRVAVILAAIGIALAMNFIMFFQEGALGRVSLKYIFCLGSLHSCRWSCDSDDIYRLLFLTVVLLEMVSFVSGSIVAATLGTKAFGKWLYGAVQILVFLKWTFGSILLDREIWKEFFGRTPATSDSLPYSSAFLLNGVLAGVRSKWGPWLWKDNLLWSRKHLH